MRGWLAAVLACAGTLSAAEPHVHGADAAPAIAALYSASDLEFLGHMIVHHEQALALCDWVAARSDRAEFQRFARYLNDAQRAEIDQMRGLLRLAADRGAAAPPLHLHGDPPMHGMLSSAEMAAIEAARGREFERLWLEGMIRHHQGAIDMALGQQEAQFRSGHQPWGLDVLVDDMLSVQRGEITQMRGWLDAWRGP